MTYPIPFTKHPYPLIDNDADGVLPQQRLANTTVTNFALVNPYFQRNPYRVSTAHSGQAIGLSNPSPNDGAWHPFTAAQWPGFTFTLPQRIAALVVSISGEIYATTNNSLVYISYQMIGSGLPGGVTFQRCALVAGSGHAYGTKTVVFFAPDAALVPGGKVTLTPYWASSGSGSHGFYAGRLGLICLHAGAQP
jgi:hypothetical protein